MADNIVALAPQGSVRDYNNSQMGLIKRTVASDCNDGEFDLFMEAARRVGLDPFRKQIYAVVYSKDNANKRKMAIITAIDGFRAVAERSGKYRPDENEPEITYDDALKGGGNPLGIVKSVVTVHKYGPDGKWHPVKGVAYWDEFAPMTEGGKWESTGETWPDGNAKKTFKGDGTFTLSATSNWKRMARIMISKCAESQAIRRGWPEDLSGVYSPEEMAQADMIDITPSEAVQRDSVEKREALINSKDSVSFLWAAGETIEYVPLGKVADRCMAFIESADSATNLDWWRSTNQMGLQSFWAKSKTDALAVKSELESRISQLSIVVEHEESDDAPPE